MRLYIAVLGVAGFAAARLAALPSEPPPDAASLPEDAVAMAEEPTVPECAPPSTRAASLARKRPGKAASTRR